MVLEDLGSTNGTYCNGERVPRQALSEGDKILLGSTTILKFSYQDQLDEAFQRQMSESALRDGLTRAYNKRYFTERIESELQYALRHATPLSLIFLDIDHFKRINDVHGHQAGDHVLVQLATLAMSMLGEDEIFARYGGEEFAVIARGMDVGGGARRCPSACAPASRRIRSCSRRRAIPVTISIGVSRAPGLGIATTVDLVARADETLYAAKRGGPQPRLRRAAAVAAARHEAVKRAVRRQRARSRCQVVVARDVDGAQAREVRRRAPARRTARSRPRAGVRSGSRPPPSTRRSRDGTSTRRRRSRPA